MRTPIVAIPLALMVCFGWCDGAPSSTFDLTEPAGNETWCHAGELAVPEPDFEQPLVAPEVLTVRVLYFIPVDHVEDPNQLSRIQQVSRDVHRWYADHTDNGRSLAWTHAVEVVHGPNTSAYYNGDVWGRVLTDLTALGYPIWGAGQVHMVWLKGGGLWAGGAQGFGNYGGNAILGAENFLENGCAPSHPSLWPCVPGGAMAHELGHALGLPHNTDVGSWFGVDLTPYTVMYSHWNFPERYARAWTVPSPYGLLNYERDILRYNPLVSEQGSPYPAIPGDAKQKPALPNPALNLTVQKISSHQTRLLWNLDGANSYHAYWSTSPNLASVTEVTGSPTPGTSIDYVDSGQTLLFFKLLEWPIHQ